MSQILNLKARGLFTNSNLLSEAPEGAMSKANNIQINADGVVESRRGFETATTFLSTDDRADVLTNYQGEVIAHRKNDNKLMTLNGSTFSGTYNHPDNSLARMKFMQANGNLYFTTSEGVQMLEEVSGAVYSTGMPRGLDGEATLAGISGFMSDNTQVAYRIVWGTRDVSNNLYLGSPSQRIIVSNAAGGSRDVALTFSIPSGISTFDFYQVYRSSQSASSSTEPNDEMQLVYENNPTAGQITAKSITMTDGTPESLKGAFLYSNSNQEGISESNDTPPFAKDITNFRNFTFFANIKTKHYLDVALLSVGGSLGLALNDTITINGMVFTAKAATTVASREFKLFTSGTPAQNIADTAKELIKVLNQYSGNTTIYGYYESAYNDLAGQILFEARSISGGSFTVSVSTTSAWDLKGGVSNNAEYPNAIMWSKLQQPEHVPASHLEFIGSKSAAIRRIIPLKDSLFVLKDDGVFRVVGVNGIWSIELVDSSTKILSPETAQVLNNNIYCLTDQGVVQISDIGVQVMSRQIEDKLIQHQYSTSSKTNSYAISYETDRKYVLCTVGSDVDTYSTKQYIYNTFTQTWVESDKTSLTGFVNPEDDKIYLAAVDAPTVLKERKSFSFRDYLDEQIIDVNYVSHSGNIILLDTVSGLNVGDLIYISDSEFSVITEINAADNQVTTLHEKGWNASAQFFKAINCELEYVNQHCGNPGVDKHYQELAVLFREQNFNTASVSFYTDISGGYESTELTGLYGGGLWGTTPWGSGLWGGVQRPLPIRCFVPRDKSRGSLLSIKFTLRVGYSKWSLNGFSLQYDFVSERLNRV